MTLLKAYLLDTDDPFVMIKCWYEDLTNTIWKAPKKKTETYLEILQHIISEQGRAGGFKYKDPNTKTTKTLNTSTLTQALKKILELDGVEEYLKTTAKAGEIPVKGSKTMGWQGRPTKSAMKSSFHSNLLSIRKLLQPFENDPKYQQDINRINAAIDKQISVLPKHFSQMRGFKADSYEEPDDSRIWATLKPYENLLEQLQDVQKINDQLGEGELDSDGNVVYPRAAVRALDKLFEQGPKVIFKLDEFIEGSKKDALGKRFSNKGNKVFEHAQELEDKIVEILTSELTIINNQGRLEKMEMIDALHKHLYPQFKGTTAFRSKEQASSVWSKVKGKREKRKNLKRAKAQRRRVAMGATSGQRERMLATYNDDMKAAMRQLGKQYYLLGLKEDRLGGRWLQRANDDIRDLEIGIRAKQRELRESLEYPPKDDDMEQEQYDQAKDKHDSKMERKYFMINADMPDREEKIQEGRDRKDELLRQQEERRIQEEAEQIEQRQTSIMETLQSGATWSNI
jgi:hypothetical protein